MRTVSKISLATQILLCSCKFNSSFFFFFKSIWPYDIECLFKYKGEMHLMNYLLCRELLDSMQAGTLEPEVAFLNASLVRLSLFFIYILYPISCFSIQFHFSIFSKLLGLISLISPK